MYLYFTAKILFLFLIELKDQTKAINIENDITEPLDAWFDSIFEIDASKAEEIVNGIIVKERYLDNLENTLYHTLNNDEQKGSLHFYKQSLKGKSSPTQIDFNSSANEIRLFYKMLELCVPGSINLLSPIRGTFDFDGRHNIENACFTFTALAPSTSDNEPIHMEMSQDFSYSGTSTKLEMRDLLTASRHPILNEVKKQFEREGPLFLKREYFYDSLEAFQSLNEIFQSAIQLKNELLSKHPSLANSPEKFYYLINEIPFFCFALKSIHIKGLSNLDTFKIGEPSPIFTHNLLINNIEGDMTLDYGSGNESPLKMNFKIEHLYLMKNGKTNCGSVQAQYWQITRAKTNTLLDSRHSQVMIDALQSAIASSILPSLKVGKMCIETPPQNINIKSGSDWESIKKSYREWVPFNNNI